MNLKLYLIIGKHTLWHTKHVLTNTSAIVLHYYYPTSCGLHESSLVFFAFTFHRFDQERKKKPHKDYWYFDIQVLGEIAHTLLLTAVVNSSEITTHTAFKGTMGGKVVWCGWGSLDYQAKQSLGSIPEDC